MSEKELEKRGFKFFKLLVLKEISYSMEIREMYLDLILFFWFYKLNREGICKIQILY